MEEARQNNSSSAARTSQIRASCERKSDGQGFISGKNIMRANCIINKGCFFFLDLDLTFSVDSKWFFK